MTITQLRPFQRDLAHDITQAWHDGARDVLGVLPCGAGKSVVAAHFLGNEQSASVFIAHRAELVSGESLALARNGVRHRVIGQPALRRECSRRHISEGLYDHVDANARVAIASVDTLVGLPASDPWLNSVRLVITDECFPAGTLVDGRPIETLRVGDTVLAFDECSGDFRRQRITRLHKNVAPEYMVGIAIKGQHVITCTSGHPFWTRRGWVTALDLTTDDEVLYALLHDRLHSTVLALRDTHSENGRDATVSLSKNWTYLLQQTLRIRLPFAARKKEGVCRARHAPADNGDLHNLRRASETNGIVDEGAIRRNGARVLWEKMLNRISRATIIRNNGADECEIRQGVDGSKLETTDRRNAEENQRQAARDRTPAEDSRRERKGCNCAGTNTRASVLGVWFHSAVRDTHWTKTWKRKISAMLQTGLSEPRIKDSVGGRRRESFSLFSARGGYEEGRIFNWARLDSVEIQKRSDFVESNVCTGDSYVYNIEVEHDHTYVANGVVVHNCHHLLRENKWGRALDMFPNSRGLGLTATACRADGKGLGRHADGVFDVLIEGPTAREIELMGFLVPHVIYAPPSDIDLSNVPVTASGDYSPKPLAAATHASHIVGDIVQHYKRLADGLLGMTFTVDVAAAMETAAAFRDAGVPAEVVTGKTPADLRNAIFRRFRAGEIKQLVSCEIAGEGFDLPDVQTISLARATESYNLATQQIGRVKRIMKGKARGIVIDHVSNVVRHCSVNLCPQTGEHYIAVGERPPTLDRRERRTSSRKPLVAVTACVMCLRTYERVVGRTCPYCKHTTEPSGRSAPEQVDGVLAELDPRALAGIVAAITHVDGAPTIPHGATPAVRGAVMRNHRERQDAQRALRNTMALWGGWHGGEVARAQRAFYLAFGVDVGTAQALGRPDADALRERVLDALRVAGVAGVDITVDTGVKLQDDVGVTTKEV